MLCWLCEVKFRFVMRRGVVSKGVVLVVCKYSTVQSSEGIWYSCGLRRYVARS